MEIVKITVSQKQAIDEALDFYNGDHDKLFNAHADVQKFNRKWSIFPLLNDISTHDMRQVLFNKFEVVEDGYFEQQVKQAEEVFVESMIKIYDSYFRSVNCRTTINRKASSLQELELDFDYELASLAYAMKTNNQAERERCNKRLQIISAQIDEEKGRQYGMHLSQSGPLQAWNS